MASKQKIFKTIKRVMIYLVLGIISLILLLFLFINLPIGKRFVKNKVENYLEDKLKTKIEIGSIDYSLPKWLKIENVYIEDQQKDTLLFGEELRVDLNMIKLIRGNTDIRKVFLKNISINVNRSATDSFFNYQFILDAFTGNKPTTPNKDTAEMKLSLAKIILNNVGLKFSDKFAGNDFSAKINKLDVSTDRFQPDRLQFFVNDFTADGIKFFMDTYKESVPDTTIETEKSLYALWITAKNLDLKNIQIQINDSISGMKYANTISHLNGTQLLFNQGTKTGMAQSISLDSSSIEFKSALAKNTKHENVTVEKDSSLPWTFKAFSVSANKINLLYNDVNKINIDGFDPSHLGIKGLNARVQKFQFTKDSTTASIQQLSFADKSGFRLDSARANFVMTDQQIAADDIYIKTGNSLIQRSFKLQYDSIAGITKNPENSLIAAKFENSKIAFDDIYMLVPTLKSSLPPAQFAHQFIVFNTELRGNLARVYLPHFNLTALSGSSINAHGTIYNLTDAKRFAFDLYLENSTFYKKDFLKFVPPTNQVQFADLPDVFNAAGHFKGTTTNVVADLKTSAKGFALNGRFIIDNLSDPKKLQFNASLNELMVDKKTIEGFVPKDVLNNLNLPNKISAKGSFKGNTNNINTDLKVQTSFGNASIKGFINNLKDSKNANYDLVLSTSGFNIGSLLKKDSMLGIVAGNFIAKGTGFDYKTMQSSIRASIDNFGFNQYDYKNATIDAQFNNGIINSSGNIQDENLKLNFIADVNVQNKYPKVKATIQIDTAQFRELNLYKDSLSFSGHLDINAENLQPRQLDAQALIKNLAISLQNKPYYLDSVSLVATSANGVDSVNLWSPMAQLKLEGAFDYDKIGTSIQRYIGQYYTFPNQEDTLGTIPDQQLAFTGKIINHPLINAFVPSLTSFQDIQFDGKYNSAERDSALNFHANIPKLKMGANGVSNGEININSTNEQIKYSVQFDTLITAAKTFYSTYVTGAAQHDSLTVNAKTKDEFKKDWFGLSVNTYVNNDVYTFKMQDSLLLNYEQWKVAGDNFLRYSKEGILINNVLLTSDSAKIYVNSKGDVANSPIEIDVDNFNLKSISSLISADTLFVGGILDVKALVSELDKNLPSFTGNASVTNLEVKNHPLGNLIATAEKKSENTITAELKLVGQGNDALAKGNYYLNNTQKEFDADLVLNQLSFKTIEAFSGGSIRNSKGNIKGKVAASGLFVNPIWNGNIAFDTTQFTISQLGTPYKIDKQTIELAYPKITLNDFTIKDSANHSLRISGYASMRSMKEYDLSAKIRANDFIVINAKKAINSQFYGYAAIDANVTVSGNTTSPQIEGDITLDKKSDVVIVLPEKNYGKEEGKSIVRFIDKDTFDFNPPVVAFEEEKEEESSFGKFLNYNLNIDVPKEAALTIVIDPITADEIKVQGDAKLNAGVDPGGNIILAGNYQLNSGYYDMHYQVLKRKFDLQKGSTITFAGTPMNAQIDITAAYTVVTSGKDLLSNEVSETGSIGTALNQKLPFKVVLHLTGVLNKPIINFDIQLANDDKTIINSDVQTAVENKLSQLRGDEAATNKQVFSLLLLNKFVSEQSSDFFKGNGANFSDIARQSVSQFLSGALNQIAGDLIKGVNIDLNLNSYNDYTTGGSTQRTDLNIAISKSFLDDRLTVTVGTNVGVEGQDAAGNAGGNGFSPDITVSYKLTKDGKYLVRAYTKNQFEVTVDGYVVENGLAFIVTMDYDKFKELFTKKKRRTRK